MASGIWLIVDSKYASDGVLVEVQAERQVDLLGYARATISRVASLHRHNGSDNFRSRSLGPRLST